VESEERSREKWEGGERKRKKQEREREAPESAFMSRYNPFKFCRSPRETGMGPSWKIG
jgi:hypothetical protein